MRTVILTPITTAIPAHLRSASAEDIIAYASKLKTKNNKTRRYLKAVFSAMTTGGHWKDAVLLREIIPSGIPLQWIRAAAIWYWAHDPMETFVNPRGNHYLVNAMSMPGYMAW